MKNAMITHLILIALMATSSWAATKEIKAHVKGMVCGFCAQGITKKLSKEEAVSKVHVNLGSKLVTVTLKEGKDLSNEKIEKVLTDSGYTVEKIERN
jgi:periplasmic mercuric ion binding protein